VSYSISSIPRIVDCLVFLVLVPGLVFFMLKDKTLLVRWISNLLPHNRPLMLQMLPQLLCRSRQSSTHGLTPPANIHCNTRTDPSILCGSWRMC